jgi:hypothetical protein
MEAHPPRVDGYRGIWFDLGQRSEFGSKYSGGLGTYTAKHHPLAIYAPAVQKTFFVYGVNDPHDNPSVQIDCTGRLWGFVSARGRTRLGHVYRTRLPSPDLDRRALERQ